MSALPISEIRFTPADERAIDEGMLGFLTCVVAGVVRLDGIALRRTLSGRLILSFPERKDRAGRSHPYIRPVDEEVRRALEATVVASFRETERNRTTSASSRAPSDATHQVHQSEEARHALDGAGLAEQDLDRGAMP